MKQNFNVQDWWRLDLKTLEIKSVKVIDPKSDNAAMITLHNGKDKFGTRVNRIGEKFQYFAQEINAQVALVELAYKELDVIKVRSSMIMQAITRAKPKIEAYVKAEEQRLQGATA